MQNFLKQQIIEILKNEKAIKSRGSLSFNDITKRVRKHNKNKKLGSFQGTLEAVYNALYELNHSGMVRQANGRWHLTNMGPEFKTNEKIKLYQSRIIHQVFEPWRLKVMASKFTTNEKKGPILFNLLTQQKVAETKLSTDNLLFQHWVFAQIGNDKIIWGSLQNESELEAVVTSWRTSRLTSADPPLLLNITEFAAFLDLVGVGISSNIFPLFGVRHLIGKELWTRTAKQVSWGKRGTIIKFQIYPFALEEIKPIKQRIKPVKIKQSNLTQLILATRLNWELLPPGWWNDHKAYSRENGIIRQELNHDDIERLKFVDSLSPEKWFVGKNYLGRRSYYVAVFPTCVIAESAEYGNAAYVIRDTTDWRSILNRTKRQVIQLGPKIVTRIRHVHNANSRIAAIVGRINS